MEDCKPVLPDLQSTTMNGPVGTGIDLSVGVSPRALPAAALCPSIEPEAIQVNDIGDAKETFMNVKECHGGTFTSLGLS
jgi:hypothetical protein